MESPPGAFGSRANLVGGCLGAGAWPRWSIEHPWAPHLELDFGSATGEGGLFWEDPSVGSSAAVTNLDCPSSWVTQVLLTGLDVLGQVPAFPPSPPLSQHVWWRPSLLLPAPLGGWLQPFSLRGHCQPLSQALPQAWPRAAQSPLWGPQMVQQQPDSCLP